jgi:hypothetical protein
MSGQRINEGVWHHGTLAQFDHFRVDVGPSERPVGNWYGYAGVHLTRERELAKSHATLRANDAASFPLRPGGGFYGRVLDVHTQIDRALLIKDETVLDQMVWELLPESVQAQYDPNVHPTRQVVIDSHPALAGQRLRQHLMDEGHDSVLYNNLAAGDDLREMRPQDCLCLLAFEPERLEIVSVDSDLYWDADDHLAVAPVGPRYRLSPLGA